MVLTVHVRQLTPINKAGCDFVADASTLEAGGPIRIGRRTTIRVMNKGARDFRFKEVITNGTGPDAEVAGWKFTGDGGGTLTVFNT